VVESLTSSVG